MDQPLRGFTRIEALLSIGIIIFMTILIFETMPGLNCKFDRVKQTQAGLQKVAGMVNLYYRDTGVLPASIDGLMHKPDGVSHWKGPYLQASQTVDAWGTALRYRAPGTGDQPFDVLSLGSDRAAGGNGDARDLSNWDRD